MFAVFAVDCACPAAVFAEFAVDCAADAEAAAPAPKSTADVEPAPMVTVPENDAFPSLSNAIVVVSVLP